MAASQHPSAGGDFEPVAGRVHFEMWGVGDKIYKGPPAPDQGWVTLPETPGLGLEPRWDALNEFEEK